MCEGLADRSAFLSEWRIAARCFDHHTNYVESHDNPMKTNEAQTLTHHGVPNREPIEHAEQILDQFTRQAVPFAASVAPSIQSFLDLVVAHAGLDDKDDVLDLACGPGVTTCALASRAAHVTGVDFVPAMLEQARKRQQEAALSNITWTQGDAMHLDFADQRFSLVTTRYSFHHLQDPKAALQEMARVCRIGGRVLVADATPAAEKADAYNGFERMRDPSHTRALPREELQALADGLPLRLLAVATYDFDAELAAILDASFPNPEHADLLRPAIAQDVTEDRLSFRAYYQGEVLRVIFPGTLLVWERLA